MSTLPILTSLAESHLAVRPGMLPAGEETALLGPPPARAGAAHGAQAPPRGVPCAPPDGSRRARWPGSATTSEVHASELETCSPSSGLTQLSMFSF